MNAKFHKVQAEGLIKEANELRQRKPLYWAEDFQAIVALAQVHATLASAEDEYPSSSNSSVFE